MLRALHQWTRQNGFPSIPKPEIMTLTSILWTQHCDTLSTHITKSTIPALGKTIEGAVFHCEDKQAPSLRIFCPCLYYKSLESTFLDGKIPGSLTTPPDDLVTQMLSSLERDFGKSYPWALGAGRQLSSGYILTRKKKQYTSGRSIISLVESPFRPMLNILARMIFQLIPVGCPDNFAVEDVFTLLKLLKDAPEYDGLRIFNQDLAGLFISIT